MEKKANLALRGGSYSLVITAVVLAVLIVVNVFVSVLPASATQYDISASQLYSITSNTKVVVNNLQQDVTIYWIVQAEAEDQIIENLLSKYESLSGRITVVKKNPDAFPTFTEQYTDAIVPNNSLIVESGERYRYVSYEDLYETELDTYSYSYVTSGFDGEGAITSAIDYVVTEDLPQLYVLEGHGETELPADFTDAVEKANIETNSLSLLNVDEIPDEADALVIYAPQSDISEEEAAMLVDYADAGGKLLVMAGPVEGEDLPNLYRVLAEYGVEPVKGLVVEGDRSYYAFGYPYILMPDLTSHEITDSLLTENYYPILPLSQGLSIGNGKGTVAELLTTSSSAYSKIAGFALETYEKEEEDTDGPFTLAVSVDTDGGGQIVWFSASGFLDEVYNSYSSGANVDLAMNALSSLIGEREAISIRSKSLSYSYLTISDTTSATLKTLMIGVFPLAYLAAGVIIYVRKRGKQNASV